MGWWRKRNKKRTLKRGAKLLEDLIECCDGKSNPIKFFSADEIRKATDNFSKSNRVSELSSNSYFEWYSGKNEKHPMILIKKGTSKFSFYPYGKFPRDIAISSMVSGQKNFLKLVGCCLEFEDPIMVFDGVKKHYKLDLREQSSKNRMKIAEDIATALTYLHTAFPRPFVYRNLSHQSILLDEDGVAKLHDFSFCVSIPKGETFVKVDYIPGTAYYRDKKYQMSRVVSEETNVFGIGVIMQMLLMGKDRYWQFRNNNEFQIRLANFVEEQRMYEIVDPDMGEISEDELSQMKALLILSQRCIACRGEVPKMVEVTKELKKIQRSLTNDSSYPFAKNQLDSAQAILSYSPEQISCRSSPEIVSPR